VGGCLVACFGLVILLSFPSIPDFVPEVTSDSISSLDLPNPLSFVPNVGQSDPVVRFQAHHLAASLFFTPAEVVLTLPSQEAQSPSPASTQVVRLQFEGANLTGPVRGRDPLPGRVSYFIGDDPAQWQSAVATYGGVTYEELYPGIRLEYSGREAVAGDSFLLKGTYQVAPGADPGQIRWHYAGAGQVRLLEASGDLLISLPDESHLIEQAPVAWQLIAGQQVPVSVHYQLTESDSWRFAFPQGFNPAYPLTIDPIISYNTFIGGSSHDYGYDLTTDAAGNVYLTGYALSTDFPTQNPYQSTHGGGMQDAFVAKLDASGTTLIYATYLGGSGNDRGLGLTVDDSGNVYLIGDTNSSNFPTQNPVQPAFGGAGPNEGDAFVAKLDASGSSLLYATYLGGKGDEIGYDIAVNSQGEAVVAGYTSSIDFPVHRAVQPNPAFPDGLNVFGDAFVTSVISASGVYTWGYSTYLGGSDWDEAHGLALDGADTAYVTGNTRSPDFPTWQAVQPLFGGGSGRGDAFVTSVISASGVYTWGYSTYLGGNSNDSAQAIAVNGSEAYVTGGTSSANFPLANPIQTSYGGEGDVFITKVISTPTGFGWGYSTYLGGNKTDEGVDLAVDSSGRAYLTGLTLSPGFPATANAFDATCGTDSTCNNSADAFLTQLNALGNGLDYSTFVGGSATDVGQGLALDSANNVYLTGFSFSEDFPTTASAYDPTCGVSGECSGSLATDVFVTKIDMSVPNESAHVIYAPIIFKSPTPSAACVPYLVTTVTVGNTPRGLALDPARHRLYVANSGSGTISVIDTNTTALLGQATALNSPTMLAYDSARSILWVTNSGQNQITPIQISPGGGSYTLLAPVAVGTTPWGVVYDPGHDYVYVANSGQDSVTVIAAGSRTVVKTFSGDFDEPYHLALNPGTGKVYVANFGNATVTVLDGTSLSSVVNLFDSAQPYGISVDETRNLIYVTTVASHRIVAIGPIGGTPDQFLGWAALIRGSNPTRPVPLRAVALNPGLGPSGDGGHVWAVTSVADGSEANEALLIPKGWSAGFHTPISFPLPAQPLDGLLVDRANNRTYVAAGTTPGSVTILGDGENFCLKPFKGGDGVRLELVRNEE
jgi:YVTN family beta-propeller protein